MYLYLYLQSGCVLLELQKYHNIYYNIQQQKMINSQPKPGYKKTREQFMQQLRDVRKQILEKLQLSQGTRQQSTPQIKSEHVDRIDRIVFRHNSRNKQGYASQLSYRSNNNYENSKIVKKESVNRVIGQRMKAELESAENIEVSKVKQEIRTPREIKEIEKSRKVRAHGAIRLKSLPSRNQQDSRATTADIQQSCFGPYFLRLSTSRANRTNSQLLPALTHLQEHNKLFQRLDSNLMLCLLRIGYFHELYPNDLLYGVNYDKPSVYIVLSGAVNIINSMIGLKKLVVAGQTLGEQMLFGSSPLRSLLEQCKAALKTYVLQIKTSDYIAVSEQAKRLGYLKQFNDLEDEFREGFTVKNIARNQHVITRRIKMSS